MERRLMRLMKHHFRKGGQKGFKKQHDTTLTGCLRQKGRMLKKHNE